MESINRRRFLKKSAAVAAGLMVGASTVKKGFAKNSPNDTINIAQVGIRGQGKVYRRYCVMPGINLAAICDIDERLFPDAVAYVKEKTGKNVKTVVDFRDLLDDKDIDAFYLSTPNHWHALHTIWACQAGKDVYVQKPCSYTVDEGRKMVEAARKYNCVVQVGTQRRSSPLFREAIKLLNDGYLGEIYMAKGLCYKPRVSIGHTKDGPIPKGVHWDIFLGPAPYRPFNENRFHYKWHWFWDTGNGDIGNQGAHEMDIARWGMNKRVHPVGIQCAGNYFAYDSDQETANTQIAIFEYEDGKLLQFEVRGLPTNAEDGVKVGNLFYGSEGWMHLDRAGGCKTYFGRKNEPGKSLSSEDFEGKGEEHFENFIRCVRSRRWEELNAEILDGHMSATLCHLANISYRVGRKLTFNPYSERFVNDDDANTYVKRVYRHPYVVPDEV